MDVAIPNSGVSICWPDDCLGVTQSTLSAEMSDAQLQLPSSVELKPIIKAVSACENKISKRQATRPHSTPLTLKWLEDNYELVEGVCIPRNAIYVHYIDFCEHSDTQPVNAASFGKIIRQQFPQVTTRRLGTRGQSKYHYYGIGVKQTSKYYDDVYSKNSQFNHGAMNDCRKDYTKQISAYSPRCRMGTLLPDFPSCADIKLPPNVPEEKVETFLMMYRTHCQRILDTIIRANFEEVQNLLVHYWQGMPPHIVPIFNSQIIAYLVGVCDAILYKAIIAVLMPSVLQPLPDSLSQVIKNFASQMDEWLHVALNGIPDVIRKIKFEQSRRFVQMLRRQSSLSQLCQASRTVVQNSELASHMMADWNSVDVSSICKQTLYTMDKYTERDHKIIIKLCKEFEALLDDESPLETFTGWLTSLVERCVVGPAARSPGCLHAISRQFLLTWSAFGTRVIRDMTLHSASSFGSFHLLHLTFDDYVLCLIENLHLQDRIHDLMRALAGEEIAADSGDDICMLPMEALSDAQGVMTGDNDVTQSQQLLALQYQADRQTVITCARQSQQPGGVASCHEGGQRQLPSDGGGVNGIVPQLTSTGVTPCYVADTALQSCTQTLKPTSAYFCTPTTSVATPGVIATNYLSYSHGGRYQDNNDNVAYGSEMSLTSYSNSSSDASGWDWLQFSRMNNNQSDFQVAQQQVNYATCSNQNASMTGTGNSAVGGGGVIQRSYDCYPSFYGSNGGGGGAGGANGNFLPVNYGSLLQYGSVGAGGGSSSRKRQRVAGTPSDVDMAMASLMDASAGAKRSTPVNSAYYCANA